MERETLVAAGLRSLRMLAHPDHSRRPTLQRTHRSLRLTRPNYWPELPRPCEPAPDPDTEARRRRHGHSRQPQVHSRPQRHQRSTPVTAVLAPILSRPQSDDKNLAKIGHWIRIAQKRTAEDAMKLPTPVEYLPDADLLHV